MPTDRPAKGKIRKVPYSFMFNYKVPWSSGTFPYSSYGTTMQKVSQHMIASKPVDTATSFHQIWMQQKRYTTISWCLIFYKWP